MKFILSDSEYVEVPEHFKGEYVQQSDGSYHLKVEGEIPEVKQANDRVVEFRNNNIALQKKNQELEESAKKFDGINPDEYRSLKDKVTQFERSGAKDPADIDARLQEAVKNAVEPLQVQLQEMQRQKQEADVALKRKDLEGRFIELARKMNVRKSAVADFIARGQQIFDIHGKAMDGDRPRFSKKNPALELTMDEWATELTQDAPHLFEPSNGGGAGGAGSPGGGGGGKTIGTDPLEFGNNLEDVAAGKTRVNHPMNQ